MPDKVTEAKVKVDILELNKEQLLEISNTKSAATLAMTEEMTKNMSGEMVGNPMLVMTFNIYITELCKAGFTYDNAKAVALTAFKTASCNAADAVFAAL